MQNPILGRRFSAALFFYLALLLTGCEEKQVFVPVAPPPDNKLPELLKQLQASYERLAGQVSVLYLIVGILAVLVIVAIFIGAGWGSSVQKGGRDESSRITRETSE